MYLLAGLGNPGEKYAGSRHNIGFSFLDYLAGKNNLVFRVSPQQMLVIETVLWQTRLIMAKPTTYMNASGVAVASLVDRYALAPERILVIHDDIDLALGRIKIVAGGGAGGHRGVSSLIDSLGTREFPRMKIGVGRPLDATPVENYVLSRFEAAELAVLADKMELLVEGVRLFVKRGAAAAMNHINSLKSA
jgi:PTH1 family peptidyl-tRNA hydrolase